MDTLLLSRDEVASLLTMKDTIEAVRAGYVDYSQAKTLQPDIVSFELPWYNGETDIKSGYSRQTDLIAVKVASGYWDNETKYQLPTMLASMTLFDGQTGYPVCFMDASLITGFRTGAAGAVAAALLVADDTEAVSVLGAGTQAFMQVLALKEILPLKQVYVWGRKQAAAERYQTKVEQELGLSVKVCRTAEEAVKSSRLLVTTTPTTTPYVQAEWVRPGTHITAVGADMPGKNELAPQLFKNSLTVVDSRPQCLARGETRNAILAGVITENEIGGEIGQFLTGEKPVPQAPGQISIFDTTGMSIQDNVTAAFLYHKALAQGIGKRITMF